MSEVKRYGFILDVPYFGERKDGSYVLASDYDALAAQRDEGLAREAELRKELELVRKAVPNSTLQLVSLQQRIAEAEKLLRKVCDEDWSGAKTSHIESFLTRPGCADGEKS